MVDERVPKSDARTEGHVDFSMLQAAWIIVIANNHSAWPSLVLMICLVPREQRNRSLARLAHHIIRFCYVSPKIIGSR